MGQLPRLLAFDEVITADVTGIDCDERWHGGEGNRSTSYHTIPVGYLMRGLDLPYN